MATRWPEVKLGDVVTIFDGPHATPPKQAKGPVFLGISNLNRGRLDLSAVEHVSEEDYSRWTRRVTPTAGDVVFSYETRLGEAAIIPPGLRCCLGRRMGLLRAKTERIDQKFLLYFYLGPFFQEVIRQRTIHGSTVDRISLNDMGDFPILLPPLAEQKRIASALSVLDDKIELNRQTNETLEAMARALFKSWFVDFDPVRTKMKSGGGRVNGASDACDLFPDKLLESPSGSGLLPEGWRLEDLAQAVAVGHGDIQTGPFGSQLHAHEYADAGIPVVMPTNISNRRIVTKKIARVSLAVAERLGRHRLSVGDLVYSRRGDVEKHALVGPEEEGWLCGTGCLRIRPSTSRHQGFSPYYLSLWLDLPRSREWIAARAVGATMPNLNTGILGEMPVLLPPMKVVESFGRLVSPLDAQVRLNRAENETLSKLREALLPRLLSGELRVRDAEHAVEAAM